jgi:hypothetical protein
VLVLPRLPTASLSLLEEPGVPAGPKLLPWFPGSSRCRRFRPARHPCHPQWHRCSASCLILRMTCRRSKLPARSYQRNSRMHLHPNRRCFAQIRANMIGSQRETRRFRISWPFPISSRNTNFEQSASFQRAQEAMSDFIRRVAVRLGRRSVERSFTVVLRIKIFIFPTGFAHTIAGWLSKSGIPASARTATLKCSRWASCPLSGVNP